MEENFQQEHLYYEYLGIAYEALNNIESSLPAYEKALSINKNLKSTRIARCFIKYRLTKDIEEDELYKVTKLVLHNADKWQTKARRLSLIYIHRKEYKKALALLERINKKTALDQFNEYYCRKQLKEEVKKPKLYKLLKNPKTTEQITILFSANPLQKNFASYNFGTDRLDIIDQTVSFYSLTYKDIYQEVKKFLRQTGYKKVRLISSSKSALGMMYAYAKLQEEMPELTLTACSCAGLITLYPRHPGLSLVPSYRWFSECMDLIPPMFEGVQEMQQIAFNLQVKKGNKFNFIYGNKSPVDKDQGAFLKASCNNIAVHGFEYSAHSITIPLTVPEGKDRAWLEEKYAKIELDADLQAIDTSLLNYVDEIEAIYKSGAKLTDYL